MRCSAFVLIEESSRFLLIQEASSKRKGKWYLPGGKIDAGENIKAGAMREVLEESGITVELISLFFLKYYEGDDDKMVFYFKGKITGGSLKKTSDKHSLKADWFTAEEITTLNLREDALRLIKTALKNPSTLPVDDLIIYPDKTPKKVSIWKRLFPFIPQG